jgi:hypothetical protein
VGNLPPRLLKDGGKEIQDSWRRTKGGSCYGTREVFVELLRSKKATGGEEFLRRLVRDDGALVEALRRERARGANEV